jgi:hypothetical protein
MTKQISERQAIHTSPPIVVIGSHRVFGRTPLDALSTFCDGHRWHAQFAPPPNVDALTSAIYPIDHPDERYRVRVTRLEVGEEGGVNAQGGGRFVAYPGDYRVTVLPRRRDGRPPGPP